MHSHRKLLSPVLGISLRGTSSSGMSYQNFNKMVCNETQSIKLERIETLCMLLNCTPNDLFSINWEQTDASNN